MPTSITGSNIWPSSIQGISNLEAVNAPITNRMITDLANRTVFLSASIDAYSAHEHTWDETQTLTSPFLVRYEGYMPVTRSVSMQTMAIAAGASSADPYASASWYGSPNLSAFQLTCKANDASI